MFPKPVGKQIQFKQIHADIILTSPDQIDDIFVLLARIIGPKWSHAQHRI